MQIRDFSLPSPYYVPAPSRFDCEERTADLQLAWKENNWAKVVGILERGPVDPAVRNEVLFHALANANDTTCAFLVSATRNLQPLDAVTDSQIFVMAAKRKLEMTLLTQREYGLVQPWAIQAALKIAEQSNDRNLENLLRQWNQ